MPLLLMVALGCVVRRLAPVGCAVRLGGVLAALAGFAIFHVTEPLCSLLLAVVAIVCLCEFAGCSCNARCLGAVTRGMGCCHHSRPTLRVPTSGRWRCRRILLRTPDLAVLHLLRIRLVFYFCRVAVILFFWRERVFWGLALFWFAL